MVYKYKEEEYSERKNETKDEPHIYHFDIGGGRQRGGDVDEHGGEDQHHGEIRSHDSLKTILLE